MRKKIGGRYETKIDRDQLRCARSPIRRHSRTGNVKMYNDLIPFAEQYGVAIALESYFELSLDGVGSAMEAYLHFLSAHLRSVVENVG